MAKKAAKKVSPKSGETKKGPANPEQVIAIQVECPPILPNSNARHIVITRANGKKESIGSTGPEQTRFFAALCNVPTHTLPVRFEIAKPIDEGLTPVPRERPKVITPQPPSPQALQAKGITEERRPVEE